MAEQTITRPGAEGPLCARWEPLLPVLEYGCAHQSCLTVVIGEPQHQGWDLVWIREREDENRG